MIEVNKDDVRYLLFIVALRMVLCAHLAPWIVPVGHLLQTYLQTCPK